MSSMKCVYRLALNCGSPSFDLMTNLRLMAAYLHVFTLWLRPDLSLANALEAHSQFAGLRFSDDAIS